MSILCPSPLCSLPLQASDFITQNIRLPNAMLCVTILSGLKQQQSFTVSQFLWVWNLGVA